MDTNWSSYSLVLIYSAIAVYTLAFVLFTFDLSKRSAEAGERALQRQSAQKSDAASGGSSVATIVRTGTTEAGAPAPTGGTRKFERIALALTWLGFVLQLLATLARGIAVGHVPWSNMFEFSLVSSLVAAGVFLGLQFWQDLRFLGAYITGFVVVSLGLGTTVFFVDVVPLHPALQSYWLIIHVFVAILATSFFTVGAGVTVAQLLKAGRESGKVRTFRGLDTLPDSNKLETLAYRVIVIGFVFWSFTLIAGAIWAERAWSRYWGWDTKEVWTFVIWVLYAGYIHARATRGWRGTRAAWLSLVGASAILFNYTIVNLFFKGLHAYSGL